MGEIVNKQRLQAILGKDHKTILKWQKEGLPIEKEGKRGESTLFNTEKVIDWMVKRASATDAELERARIRSINATAEKTELEVEEMKGNLIALDEMKGMWAKVLGAFRARVLSMPSRLTPQLAAVRDPKKIEKLLKDTCYEALTELSEYEPENNPKAKAGSKRGAKYSGTASAVKPE